jgi:hypothetical protein
VDFIQVPHCHRLSHELADALVERTSNDCVHPPIRTTLVVKRRPFPQLSGGIKVDGALPFHCQPMRDHRAAGAFRGDDDRGCRYFLERFLAAALACAGQARGKPSRLRVGQPHQPSVPSRVDSLPRLQAELASAPKPPAVLMSDATEQCSKFSHEPFPELEAGYKPPPAAKPNGA